MEKETLDFDKTPSANRLHISFFWQTQRWKIQRCQRCHGAGFIYRIRGKRHHHRPSQKGHGIAAPGTGGDHRHPPASTTTAK